MQVKLDIELTFISSRCVELWIVVDRIPVVLRWVTGIPAPFEVLSSVLTLDDILGQTPGEERVQLTFEEGEWNGVRSLALEGVVEDRLLVGLAPSMRPAVFHPIQLHPKTRHEHSSYTINKR